MKMLDNVANATENYRYLINNFGKDLFIQDINVVLPATRSIYCLSIADYQRSRNVRDYILRGLVIDVTEKVLEAKQLRQPLSITLPTVREKTSSEIPSNFQSAEEILHGKKAASQVEYMSINEVSRATAHLDQYEVIERGRKAQEIYNQTVARISNVNMRANVDTENTIVGEQIVLPFQNTQGQKGNESKNNNDVLKDIVE